MTGEDAASAPKWPGREVALRQQAKAVHEGVQDAFRIMENVVWLLGGGR